MLAGACGYTSYESCEWTKRELGEDALSRTLSFYSVALPAFFEYKALEYRCEMLPRLVKGTPMARLCPEMSADVEAARFEPLHSKWAPAFRSKFLELRGFYLKHGQGIANNVADLFPKTWQNEMEPLLDKVPPQPVVRIREILAAEGISDIQVADGPPLGSASIGQVHRARWRDQNVVVKVQYPEVERTFRGDVLAVKRVCRELFPQYYIAFEEIERQFRTEFDYRGEAANTKDIRRSLASNPYSREILVPAVHLATRRCLVMDEVPGVPLTKALRRLAKVEAARRGLDSIEALVAVEDAAAEQAAKKGQLLQNSWWVSHYWKSNALPVSPANLVDRLLQVHGHQVLIDGCFSGDPHPGNCLIDSDGKIALIDFGQVKRIDERARLAVAKLLLLVDEAVKHDPRTTNQPPDDAFQRAKRAVATAMLDMGFKTQRADPDVLYSMASVYFGRDDRAWLYPNNFQQWTDEMQRLDPVESLDECEPMVFVVRFARVV